MKANPKQIRVRRTESEIKSLVKAQAVSNTPVNEFCMAHQISRGLFYSWCKKYGPIKKEPGFIPVCLADNEPEQTIFAEIEFSQKLVVRLFQHVDSSYLKALVKL